MWSYKIKTLLTAIIMAVCFSGVAKDPYVAYDIDMSLEICSTLPLESVEGIWLYPDDKVTVLILNSSQSANHNTFPEYTISVVETSDVRLHPGEVIGKLNATVNPDLFTIELATEKKNDLLLKPKAVTATLGKEGDTFTFKKSKSALRGRLNFNFNRLLPGFWKIISTGISTVSGTKTESPVGMIKIYPSYDGNGSSRRKIRYL